MLGTFIVVGLIGTFIIFVNPFFGLILTTIMLPQALLQAITSRFLGFISMGTPIKLIGGITFVATFIKIISERRTSSFLNINTIKLFMIFLIWIYISGFTQVGAFTRSNFTVFTSMAIFGFIILALVNTLSRFRIILLVALMATFLSSLSAVLGFSSSQDVRMSGSYYGPNEYAILLLPMLAFSFYIAFSTRNRSGRFYLYIIGGILILAVISTLSRGGIVGLGTMTLIASCRAKKKIRAWLLVLVAALVFINFMPQSLRSRFNKTRVEDKYTGEGDVDSTTRRYNLALAAWRMFLEHPIAGWGIGNYYYNCSNYAFVSPGRAHNMYLEVMAELGIIGIILLLAIIFSTLRILNRISKLNIKPFSIYASGLYIGLIGFCAAAFFLHAEQEKILWFTIFMTVALSNITPINTKKG